MYFEMLIVCMSVRTSVRNAFWQLGNTRTTIIGLGVDELINF